MNTAAITMARPTSPTQAPVNELRLFQLLTFFVSGLTLGPMQTNPSKCWSCKSAQLIPSMRVRTMVFGGVSFSGELPCLRCEGCGEETASDADLARFETAVALALLERRQSSEGFRFLRKKALLPAKELAPLLEVTPETVSAWETGKHLPPRAAWLVVGSLAHEQLTGGGPTLARMKGILERKSPEVRVFLADEKEKAE